MRLRLASIALTSAIFAASFVSACSCGEKDEPVASEPTPEPTPTIQTRARTTPLKTLVVAAASQLDDYDLSTVESLDLAMSIRDGQERPLPLPEEPPGPVNGAGETDGEEPQAPLSSPRCEGLDLHALAARTPKLRVLRISGCQAAVHAGLSAFGEQLRELELVDLELDAVSVARLSQLHGLERLTLTRVHAEPDALKPLGRKISPQILVLRELADNSPVSEIFKILGDIREIRVAGPWVHHDTMLRIAKARRLERLAVLDTDMTNFSLAQLRGLEHLRTLEWSGPGFNNTSPIYIRDVPITELICDCPRFGDKGLHQLYLWEELERLVLERSDISSEGLAELTTSTKALRDLTIRYRDLDNLAFTNLGQLTGLERLILGPGKLLEPEAEGLGLLIALRELEIDLEGFGDPAAAQLATLVALEQLELGGTDISDEGLEHLAALTRLRELSLHHTRVTKHGLEHLGGMSALEILELDHTDVVDEGVAHLAGLRALRELRLDHTLITDVALSALLGLDALERLNLAHTVVSAEGVATLEALPRLEAVNLEGTRALTEAPAR